MAWVLALPRTCETFQWLEGWRSWVILRGEVEELTVSGENLGNKRAPRVVCGNQGQS